MDRLIKLYITLNKEGLSVLETKWVCKESKKVFLLSRTDDDGEITNRRVDKSDLNNIHRTAYNSPHELSYSVLTTDDFANEMRQKILSLMKIELLNYKSAIEKLEKHL